MNEEAKQNDLQGGPDKAESAPNAANEPELSSRRELIERYAKYAVIGAPLLVFVSKAQAIHSKP